MTIVIIDSGLSERYEGCNRIVFPISTGKNEPPIASGHGTAVYNIISRKCSDFAEIINFRILNIENGISEEMLIDALSFVSKNLHPDVVNLSLGITECNNIQGLYNICSDLNKKGSIIVSAFDNSGCISYPAAFNNVIGVVSGNSCLKTDDFEFFDDDIVNIGAKGNNQRLVWDNPHSVFLSGNSFACAHVTSKIAEMIFSSTEPLSMKEILERLKCIAIKRHSRLPEFSFPQIPFDIKRAAVFPFAKEAHSMVRFADLLNFKIADIYDTKYSVKIGSNTAHLMNDVRVPVYTIKNINNIDYDSFDTLILGHLDELAVAIKREDFVTNLISTTLQHKKRIFSFDDLNKFGFVESNEIYFPAISSHNVPPNRLGMLYQISTPVVGVFGTSSKQGKFTLQLMLRRIMVEQGYSVGGLGTEPTSQLFGMDYVFPMGYNSTVYIDYNAVIHFLNSAMHSISIKKKDIIIVGSQSGTIPYAYGNISYYPTFQHAFLMGTLPDCIVLCVNVFDPLEYIHRTIAFLESAANSKVIALAAIPFNTITHTNSSFEKGKTIISDDFCDLQRRYKSEFNIPLYNIVEKKDMIKLSKQIVKFFL